MTIDKSKWYCAKFPTTKYLSLPINGWKSFPSATIPKDFKYENIGQYVMRSTYQYSSDTDDDSGYLPVTGHNKSLRRGRICFSSGHVTNLEDVADDTFYYLRYIVLNPIDGTYANNKIFLN